MAKPVLKEPDPLALAKWTYGRYAERTEALPALPQDNKIVMLPSKSTSRGTKKAPARSGESWDDKERVQLVKAFLKGDHIANIAMEHQRTVGALLSQLKWLGFDLDE